MSASCLKIAGGVGGGGVGVAGLVVGATYLFGEPALKEFRNQVENMTANARSDFLALVQSANETLMETIKSTQIAIANISLSTEVGEVFGEGVENAINGALDKLNVTSITDRLMEDVNKMGDQVLEEAKVVMEKVRLIGMDEIKKVRANIQEVFSDVLKSFTLESLPWIALGSAVAVGTPLTVFYTYHALKHKIGRPKLAQERKSYDALDRASEAARGVFKWAWNSTQEGLKWGAGSLLAVSVGASFATLSMKVESYFNSTCSSDIMWYSEFTKDLWCNIEKAFTRLKAPEEAQKIICQASEKNLISFDTVVLASQCIGAAAVVYYTAKSVASYFIKSLGVKGAKPIFNNSIKETIDDVIDSVKNLKKNGGYFQNLLLYGPGGTGKTMVSKFIARNSGMNYVMMSGGDLAQYIKRGEHVTELNRLFEDAKSSNGSTIIFIDEAESLCRDRSQIERDELFELMNAFLNQTGEPSDKIMLIMATNRPGDLDEAVLSRMDNKVEIGPPEFKERKNILKMYLTHFFSSSEIRKFFTEEILDQISQKTEGLTGRTLFKMLNALSTKKKCSRNNRLTDEMVEKLVDRFVAQEKGIKKTIT